ncbi:MAG: hypothetical protein ACOC6B_06735 [Thermodesulfobacteriota bacterium]
MVSEEAVTIFLSEFDLQVKEIRNAYDNLQERFEKTRKEPVSKELVESIGYWLHNLYTAYEALFEQVASFWENSFQETGRYHMQLLKRMRLDIPGIRPPLLRSDESYLCLDELRGFRHVFRYAYSYGLDDERVFRLVGKVLAEKEAILRDISEFRKAVQAMCS